MRSLALLSLVLLSLARGALAAATLPELDARVTKLSGDVDELKKLTVEMPTLQQTVNDVSAQLTALKQEVEKFRRVNESEMDERARLDQLDSRLTVLGQQVSSLRADLQARGAPEASAPFGSATYRDGFLLATEDGNFSLRLRGYAQFRYALRTAESDATDVEESSFLLRRGRIVWDGNAFSPKLTYRFMAEVGAGQVALLDYYAEGRVHPMVSIRAGQFKVPLSRNFTNPEDLLSFLERAVATEEFRYDRDLGVMAIVRPHERVEIDLCLFNGAGPNVAQNDNIDPLLVARVQGAVLGKAWTPEEGDRESTISPALMLGAAGSFENTPVPDQYGYLSAAPLAQAIDNPDVDADDERDNVRVMQLALDVGFRWRGLGIEGEAYFRNEDWGAIGMGQSTPFVANDNYQGGFVQASYFLVPERYVLGARASFAEVSPLMIGGRRRQTTSCMLGSTPADCALPLSDLRTEFTVMASYLRHRHGIELTAMYSFLDWATRDGADPADAGEHRILVESQIGF